MNSTTPFAQPPLLETLQRYTPSEPLPPEVVESLRHIESLNLSSFNEADVRAHVLEPIVRALGYSKDTDFSDEREQKIKFLEEKEKKKKHKNKPGDNPKLWKENFWLAEAKRPRLNEEAFHYEELKQAMEYACHPEINAVLVVLCDGLKIEVFDRETHVTAPVVRIPCNRLLAEFDKLQALLGPRQSDFFQKRRLLRLLDNVFEQEFNPGPLEADNTRALLLENVRKQPDSDSQAKAQLNAASMEALIEIHMFQQHSTCATQALLAALADKNPSLLLSQMLPDKARVLSDMYMGHALACLMELDRQGVQNPEFMPRWLADTPNHADLKAAIRKLFHLCLTYFEGDPQRRFSLLAAAACRRLAKAQFVLSETPWALSKVLHFMHRLETPRHSFSQMAGALESHALAMLNVSSRLATCRFMESLQTNDSAFDAKTATLQLQKMWDLEKQLLAKAQDYPKLQAERHLGETLLPESCCVSFDFLGHMALCLLQLFPEWKDEVLQNHPAEVSSLAKMGSWAAKKLLGLKADETVEPPEEAFLADRFFLGDVETLRFLRAKYGGQATNATP